MESKTEHRVNVAILKDTPERKQLANIQNATFQAINNELVMSIAMHISIPHHVSEQGQEAILQWLKANLPKYSTIKGMCIHIWLGESSRANRKID